MEIKFKIKLKKEDYQTYIQKEHWGNFNDDVENIKIHKDTKASLKKNFNDRQSQVIITLKNGGVVTVDIGLTSMKKLKKIENEINSHLN